MNNKIKSFAKKIKITRPLWHFYQAFAYSLKHHNESYSKKNREGVIVQLVSTFSEKDAIGNSIIEISNALTKKGIQNYIAYEASYSKKDNGVPISCFKFNPNDTIIYHMGSGCKMSDIYKKVKVKKKIMYYHNITPSKYFYDMPYDKKDLN